MMNDETLPPPLAIRVEAQGDVLVVFVAGELDMASKGQLAAAVAERQRPDVVRVIIDMAELEFMDSTGLSEIVLINVAGESEGLKVTVRGARPQVRRVFEITGLHRFLDD